MHKILVCSGIMLDRCGSVVILFIFVRLGYITKPAQLLRLRNMIELFKNTKGFRSGSLLPGSSQKAIG